MPSPTDLAPAVDAFVPVASFGLREAVILLWGLFGLAVLPWSAHSQAATLRGGLFLLRLPERLWSRARAHGGWSAAAPGAPARWSRARA
jgi:hypothetical protein